MELPKDATNRVGDLPAELRQELKAYIITPKITINPNCADEFPDYIITITYPDESFTKINVMFNINICSNILTEIIKPSYVIKIGEIDGEMMSQNIYLNNDGTITTQRSSLCIALKNNAFSIFKQKLTNFISDYIKFKKDPNNCTVKEEY